MSELDTRRTGFELQPLPIVLRGPNALAEALGVRSPELTPEQLVRAAARKAGLAARFPAHIDAALEVLCRSLHDDGHLHWFGRMDAWNLLVTGLASWLEVEQAFCDDPRLAEQALIPPLIVTGLPRSGTTFLHRMLSAVEQAGSITMFDHLYPSPRRRKLRRVEVELQFWPWRLASRSYGFDAIHYVRPSLPDECNFGMRPSMRSMIFWAIAPTYGYLRWLLEQDLRESYGFYRKILLLHQARAPGRRLTLKCPHHLAWLPALAEALPEALIVQTHRDPLECVPSECKLVLSLHGMATTRLDWRRTVECNHLKVRTFAERSLEFADTEAGARVLHVDYRELVREPVAVARSVHEHFGLRFDVREQAALAEFAADNRQYKHGKNPYALGQFALDADEIRAAFGPYWERFGAS